MPMASKLGITVYTYSRARIGDLDLDVRSQWFDKGKIKSALNYLDN